MRTKTTPAVGFIRFEKAFNYSEIKNILENSQVGLHFYPKKRAARKAKPQAQA